jgi:anti-sigma B factor antagonist
MEIDVQTVETGDSTTIIIYGDVEMIRMKALKEKLFNIVNNTEKDIIIDFANVAYLDSSGIGVLITISKTLKEKGKGLKLSNLSERITRVLELSSLADVIE